MSSDETLDRVAANVADSIVFPIAPLTEEEIAAKVRDMLRYAYLLGRRDAIDQGSALLLEMRNAPAR